MHSSGQLGGKMVERLFYRYLITAPVSSKHKKKKAPTTMFMVPLWSG